MRTFLIAIFLAMAAMPLTLLGQQEASLAGVQWPPEATPIAEGIPWPPPWSGPIDRPWTMYDGYWHTGWWIPGMISNSSYFQPSPQYHYGAATFYAEGVMEATAHARGMSLQGYLDGVSLMSPADIGEVIWLRPEGREWDGPYLVVDCAQRDDILRYIGPGDEAVEVGYTTAVRWGMVAPVRRCCWVEDMIIQRWSLDKVYVFKGQEVPPADVLAQHLAIRLAPWWLARAHLEDFSDSPYWLPDPAPTQGQYGQWIYYENGERFEQVVFPVPESFWPPLE